MIQACDGAVVMKGAADYGVTAGDAVVLAAWRVAIGVVRGFRQEMPGFAVGLEAHDFGLAMRIEAKHGAGLGDFHRDDVPGVERDDIAGDEVGIGGGVDGTAFAAGVSGAGFVGSRTKGVGSLDLDAPEAGAVVDDEVVALAVSPGLGDDEAEAGGANDEGGFGKLSDTFGIFAVAIVL